MTTVQVIKKLLNTRGDRNDQLQIFTSRGREEEEKKNLPRVGFEPGTSRIKVRCSTNWPIEAVHMCTCQLHQYDNWILDTFYNDIPRSTSYMYMLKTVYHDKLKRKTSIFFYQYGWSWFIDIKTHFGTVFWM